MRQQLSPIGNQAPSQLPSHREHAAAADSSWRFADIPVSPPATRADTPRPQPDSFAAARASVCSDGIDLKGNGQDLTDQVSPDAGVPAPPDAGAPAARDAGTPAQVPPDAGVAPAVPQTPPAGSGAPAAPGTAPPTPAAVTSVTFGTVNSPTTPAGVIARIPPRIDQSIAATVTGTGSVVISVDGASATNGTATLNGAATATLAATGVVALRGTTQTAVGSAGNLKLVAKVGGTTVGTSNAFTICAIPTTVTISPGSLITGTERGIEAITSNNSDSGVVADLDMVQMSEKVQYVGGTGCFAGITSGSNSGFLPANVSPHGTDHHGTPVSRITGAGAIDSRQLFVFNDTRSGATNVVVTNSGFNIHREVTATAAGSGTSLSITTSKTGVATTVSSVSASAGSGSASSGAQAV
ncbi:hypothetical protein [Dyella tabacisoli]|uniref:Uncharacterized protein n=1 Tax=Dyella tabacisoli TaxID=2282381 RepID=A0A369UL96_9GAMM|nr:hypothetical protein [Dyella tabacisoli]RDD81542.1 hypothetical protein DVJ77_10205 [Dyella tabacisoli]